MESKLALIGPKEFKELYASQVGIETIRELFRDDSFPSVTIGNGERKRTYTTRAAAEKWLEQLGGTRR